LAKRAGDALTGKVLDEVEKGFLIVIDREPEAVHRALSAA
jgi:hypothetical protein